MNETKYLMYNYEKKKDRAEKSTTHKSECKWVKAGVVENHTTSLEAQQQRTTLNGTKRMS
jgi:hypothetical protein